MKDKQVTRAIGGLRAGDMASKAPEGFFVLFDRLTRNEREALGPWKVRAEATGEFRRPRKGEWYLSGAVVEAYRAYADMDAAYFLARLVVLESERAR